MTEPEKKEVGDILLSSVLIVIGIIVITINPPGLIFFGLAVVPIYAGLYILTM